MKKNYVIFILIFLGFSFLSKVNSDYGQVLENENLIREINLLRPKIYLYTDFGGGQNKDRLVVDLQTSGEISGAAWKSTLQQELYINDSAKPLSPLHAAIYLAKTFPFEKSQTTQIKAIVIHVVDPGVGNDQNKNNPQPRSLVLRKDGVLFIGPDNGTLSFVCPPGSIVGIWQININDVTAFSGVNTQAGGTFHGRDIFAEAAFRIAARISTPGKIGTAYKKLELINRIPLPAEYQKIREEIMPLKFERVQTSRFVYEAAAKNDHELFDKAFLLGVIQSSLYQDGKKVALTHAKRVFLPQKQVSDDLIAIINNKTDNVFIGSNSGIGSAFFKEFSHQDFEVFKVGRQAFESIKKESNSETVVRLLRRQTRFQGKLSEIDFLGGSKDVVKDWLGRPKNVKAKIWVDLYGNIKTTVSSRLLNEVKKLHAFVAVELNGVRKNVTLANTFSEVPRGQLFIYNGSTGQFGPNPHRSERYVELTANGVFGEFGTDFFEKNGVKPKSGDTIRFFFAY
jgi:S-adenosylmethionine hydrolase